MRGRGRKGKSGKIGRATGAIPIGLIEGDGRQARSMRPE